MSHSGFVSCPKGLENLLADELKALSVSQIKVRLGGVMFETDWLGICRINLYSRFATRVLWQVARATYRNEDDIYRHAYACTWAKWFTQEQSIRVNVTMQGSTLKSREFVTLRVKDAICDHFRNVKGDRPDVNTQDPDVRIHAFVSGTEITLYLDTSGEPLYRRGYKQAKIEAPLKENLAAAMLAWSGWQPDQALVDPMCGSGTILLEAAAWGCGIAPGVGREFALERFRNHDAVEMGKLRVAARRPQRQPSSLRLFAADSDRTALAKTQENMEFAGFELSAETCVDILELKAPAESGVLLANPPYGVRLGEVGELSHWYPRLGDALKANWQNWLCGFITADPELPRGIGLAAKKKTPLFNGALECRFYTFPMVGGSNRRRNTE